MSRAFGNRMLNPFVAAEEPQIQVILHQLFYLSYIFGFQSPPVSGSLDRLIWFANPFHY
jgi:hypothetical protein